MTTKNDKEFTCSFRELTNVPGDGTRKGRYSGCNHWDVAGFGDNRWVVLGYLDVDWKALGISQETLLAECLRFLNKVPERKKHAKKEPKPLYGNLSPYKADFVTKNDKNFIIVQFITDEPNNPNFWGAGQSWSGGLKVAKKRGRPPKIKTDNS